MLTKAKRNVKNKLQRFLKSCGYQVRKHYDSCDDIGREYSDSDEEMPHFVLKKSPPTPWSGNNVLFSIDNGQNTLNEIVYYSHLTLLKLCKQYEFETVLDIGSHERKITKIFEHIGKKVTTIEIAPGYEADIKKDYLDHSFTEPFDAIWCSQIYEHQRNPGRFLDKIFDELKDGGILALTVPFQVDHYVMFGHLNLTSPLMLIYHLVCAGFDCSEMALKCFNGSIGVILKKRYNGIKRGLAFGSLPVLPSTTKEAIAMQGNELFGNMIASFPPSLRDEVKQNLLTSRLLSINWGNPI